jgi:hypothetical protein
VGNPHPLRRRSAANPAPVSRQVPWLRAPGTIVPWLPQIEYRDCRTGRSARTEEATLCPPRAAVAFQFRLLLADPEAVAQGRTCLLQEASLPSSYPKCATDIPSAATRMPCACSCRTGRLRQPCRIARSRTLRGSPITCQHRRRSGLSFRTSAFRSQYRRSDVAWARTAHSPRSSGL